jgi:hypothetical protein
MAVSVGMFPQKTHLFTTMLWHQFLQRLWRDCKLWLQLRIHQTVKAYNLSWLQLWIHHDATPSKPEQLPKWICTVPSYESNLRCVWKPPNQSWTYRTSSQGLNKDHLVMESRKTNHPVTFNWNNKINQHNTSDFYLNTSTLMWFWPGQIAQAFHQKVSKSMEPEQ